MCVTLPGAFTGACTRDWSVDLDHMEIIGRKFDSCTQIGGVHNFIRVLEGLRNKLHDPKPDDFAFIRGFQAGLRRDVRDELDQRGVYTSNTSAGDYMRQAINADKKLYNTWRVQSGDASALRVKKLISPGGISIK
ncbi:Hypothetical predicted protein [Lecanosticta acicola]|uniref:Uncharacterized protein n=1 Tax=Lecanosticta acicola TaxID=111012 RepID=A0AAI9EF09_9PEZI|nr:Hypothetical predicted protein [Lecanosticta acicola]